MPRGDHTGPIGMGPRSGRAAGFCAGFGMPGYANPAPGRGFGMGHGMGFGRGRGIGGCGRRNMFYATGLPGWQRFGEYAAAFQKPDPEMEKQALNNEAAALQTELNAVKKRLDEIETKKASE
jgi:hypothetical protein